MKLKLIALTIITFAHAMAHNKVRIFTHAYNRPEFIELQHLTFEKFMLDDYEFIVWSDARDDAMHSKIENECKKYGLRCIRIPQEIHNKPYLKRWPGEDYNSPSVRTSNVIQYSLNECGFDYPGMVVIIDSDMFLLKEFSFIEYMKGYQLAGISQIRGKGSQSIEYIWNRLYGYAQFA